MDIDVRSVFHNSSYRRVASIALTSACILCCIPQNAYCLANEDIAKELLETQDIDHLKDQFDALEKSIEKSDDAIAEGRQFIESFLVQIQSQYGISLSLPEACQLVKANLSTLDLPLETKESLLIAIEILSLEEATEMNRTAESNGLGKSLQNGWDYLRGKKQLNKKNGKTKITFFQRSAAQITTPEVELPGNVYAGAMEAFAGALLCIIPHPITWRMGIAMMLDGGRRIADGYIQASDEERLNRQYPH